MSCAAIWEQICSNSTVGNGKNDYFSCSCFPVKSFMLDKTGIRFRLLKLAIEIGHCQNELVHLLTRPSCHQRQEETYYRLRTHHIFFCLVVIFQLFLLLQPHFILYKYDLHPFSSKLNFTTEYCYPANSQFNEPKDRTIAIV